MKGLRGRRGIAHGHNPNDPLFNLGNKDNKLSGLQQLIKWVGLASTEIYLAHMNKTIEKEKVVKLTWRQKMAATQIV